MAESKPHTSDAASDAPQPGSEPGRHPVSPGDAAIRPVRLAAHPGAFVIVAILSGVAACFALTHSEGHFKFEADQVEVESAGPVTPASQDFVTPETQRQINAQSHSIYLKNTSLAFGWIGLLVAGSLGLLEGVARRSFRQMLVGGGAGLAIGILFGAAGGLFAAVADARFGLADGESLYRPMLLHGLAWGIVGIGVGLAVTFPFRQFRLAAACAGRGILAGVIAAVLYLPLAMVLFPTDNPAVAVPQGTGNRLLWVLLATGLMGLMIGTTRRSPKVAQS